MIKPKTIGIQALAARWGCQPKQIIEAAIDGQIKLYFSLGNCTIADLPNPNLHHRLHERPYQGGLQADQPTLNDLLHTNEARHVEEAYTPEGAWVRVALPAQELSPQMGGHAMQTHNQITPPLNIKTDDLHAFMEDVEVCERDGHEPVSEPENSVSQAPACELLMMATRAQLINAFGRFTGMDASWFSNLKDTPALLRARKVPGQGGRGHISEPLFCPFEVMQWLAESKHRKGRKLGAETAWRLLQENFPEVYNAYSVGDPRPGD